MVRRPAAGRRRTVPTSREPEAGDTRLTGGRVSTRTSPVFWTAWLPEVSTASIVYVYRPSGTTVPSSSLPSQVSVRAPVARSASTRVRTTAPPGPAIASVTARRGRERVADGGRVVVRSRPSGLKESGESETLVMVNPLSTVSVPSGTSRKALLVAAGVGVGPAGGDRVGAVEAVVLSRSAVQVPSACWTG